MLDAGGASPLPIRANWAGEIRPLSRLGRSLGRLDAQNLAANLVHSGFPSFAAHGFTSAPALFSRIFSQGMFNASNEFLSIGSHANWHAAPPHFWQFGGHHWESGTQVLPQFDGIHVARKLVHLEGNDGNIEAFGVGRQSLIRTAIQEMDVRQVGYQ